MHCVTRVVSWVGNVNLTIQTIAGRQLRPDRDRADTTRWHVAPNTAHITGNPSPKPTGTRTTHRLNFNLLSSHRIVAPAHQQATSGDGFKLRSRRIEPLSLVLPEVVNNLAPEITSAIAPIQRQLNGESPNFCGPTDTPVIFARPTFCSPAWNSSVPSPGLVGSALCLRLAEIRHQAGAPQLPCSVRQFFQRIWLVSRFLTSFFAFNEILWVIRRGGDVVPFNVSGLGQFPLYRAFGFAVSSIPLDAIALV